MMPQPSGASSPSQQLGAVPGTIEGMVPGLREFIEPEDIDGEFASSAEAEIAPRDGDYDTASRRVAAAGAASGLCIP